MPLQNRVTPEGEIIATPHRGLLMGNRGGAFHTPDRPSAPAAGPPGNGSPACWSSRAGTGRSCSPTATPSCSSWTRPRRSPPATGPASNAVAPTPTGSPSCGPKRTAATSAPAPRPWTRCCTPNAWTATAGRSHFARGAPNIPSGAFVRYAQDGAQARAYLVVGNHLLAWEPAGYTALVSPSAIAEEVEVLTPASIVAVLSAGYRPMLHPSAAALLG